MIDSECDAPTAHDQPVSIRIKANGCETNFGSVASFISDAICVRREIFVFAHQVNIAKTGKQTAKYFRDCCERLFGVTLLTFDAGRSDNNDNDDGSDDPHYIFAENRLLVGARDHRL